MNYLEFKRQLMVDPYLRDPAFLAAKEQDAQFADAAEESQDFERMLQSAMKVEVPPGLADQIILRTSIEEGLSAQPAPAVVGKVRPLWPQAIAASLFAAAITAGVMTWKLDNDKHGPGSMESFVVEHWTYDGAPALQQASAQFSSAGDLRQLLASVGVEADDALLQRIRFGKNCPTPEGKGAHLVINTDNGPITLFYAPGVSSEANQMSLGEVVAVLINMQSGSAALLGDDESSVREVEELVKDGLHPMTTRT